MTKRHIKLVLVLVNLLQFLKLTLNRDICKPRKRQHWYPEFGHTKGQIKKIHAKNYISIQGGAGRGGGEIQKTINFHDFLSFNLPKTKRLLLLGQLNWLVHMWHILHLQLEIIIFFQFIYLFLKRRFHCPRFYISKSLQLKNNYTKEALCFVFVTIT